MWATVKIVQNNVSYSVSVRIPAVVHVAMTGIYSVEMRDKARGKLDN